MSNKTVRSILEEIAHSWCQNCDGENPIVESRDEEIIDLALKNLYELLKLSENRPYFEQNPRMSEEENHSLRMWDNGYNKARDEDNAILKTKLEQE